MRSTTRLPLWGLLLCLTGVLCLSGQRVLAATPMRAVILFDNSGSMRQNDPQRLSRLAAQLFLELVRPQDQVGLVAFSDAGRTLMPLSTIDSLTVKQTFLARLGTLRFDGQITDLSTALQAGLASFPPHGAESHRDLVLLLTDGQLDLGPQRRTAEPLALDYIRRTLLPQYLQRGISIYTIAFTAAADRILLQDIAQATHGEYRFVPSAPMLHKAFSELFMVAKAAESIPMQNGAVVMDSSIKEAALVLAKPDPQEALGLVTPQQQRLHAHSTYPGVHWQTTPAYDMIQLSQPEPGTWRVERASDGKDDIAIIGASTLSLVVTLGSDYLEAGEPLAIQARLLEHDQPLHDPQQWQAFTMQVELIPPAGQRQTLLFHPGPGPGEFTATSITPEAVGQYGLVVTAMSPTVQRQRTLSFIPQPRCFTPSVLAEPTLTVQVALSDACPVFNRLECEVGYVAEPAQAPVTWLPLAAQPAHLFQATLPHPAAEAQYGVLLRIRGQWGHQPDFTIIKGPLPLPQLTPPVLVTPRLDWFALSKTVGWQLLLVNTLLGVFGGGGYALYRYRMRHRRTSNA